MNPYGSKLSTGPKTQDLGGKDLVNNGLSLSELQSQFKQYLMFQNGKIDEHIYSTEELSNDFRLAIYANAYCMRLVETLQKDFPAIFYLLGDDAFTQVALAYIKEHPSQHPSLRFFGQYFSEFLHQDTDYRAMSYLSELAQLEWLLVEAFNAKDVSVIQESDVANVPPEAWSTLVLHFQASVHCFQYRWNIIPLWQAEQNEQIPPQPEELDSEELCLVWRQNYMTRYRTLEPDEALVLGSMLEGADFSDMCASLSTIVAADEVALKAAGLLKFWVNAGLISDLSW